MKKFFARLVIFLSLLLMSVVAIPWNQIVQAGVPLQYLQDNELLVKAGIAGLLLILSLVFLFVTNREYTNEGLVSPSSSRAAFLPLWMYATGATILGIIVALFVYLYEGQRANDLYVLIGSGVYLLNILGFGHMIASGFKKRRNGGRILIFLFLIELVGISAGIFYYLTNIRLTFADYSAYNTALYVYAAAAPLVFYVLHIVILSLRSKRVTEEELLETEVQEMSRPQGQETPRAQIQKRSEEATIIEVPSTKAVKASKGKRQEKGEVSDPRKSFIVSKDESIVSTGKGLDPTNILYEEVSVDPEFNRTANSERLANSIDYYIEKPKMFKPLDPTFDVLVEYVRELPGTVTKITDEKITFYLDRNPFLVLMNYGNYYRIAFRSELEKGIRLIIKYPTISKNKSTKDDLWFKANNYGDLPKEVVYQIVKSAYDSASH